MRQYGSVPPVLAANNIPVVSATTGLGGLLGNLLSGGASVQTPSNGGFGEIDVFCGADNANLVSQQRSPATSPWAPTALTVSNSAPVSNPVDASQTVGTLTDTAANSIHILSQAITYVNGTSYVHQGDFKAGSATVIQLSFNASVVANGFANFNLANGTVGTTGVGLTGSGIISLGNGWYRCWIAGTAIASANHSAVWALTNNNTSAGDTPTYVGSGEFLYATNFGVWGGVSTIQPFPNNNTPAPGSVSIKFPNTPPSLFIGSSEFGPLTVSTVGNVVTVSWGAAQLLPRSTKYKISYEWLNSN